MTNATASTSLGHDARTIGLVGLAHGASHFFHLLLPPLFPWLMAEFGYSYVELGTVVSVFFVVSGVGQMLAGFLVDKVGARPILFAALASFALAGLVAASAQNYAMLVAAAVLAGLGNAPFHPVDFTILNQRVSPQNMGHAFSVHGISGNVGWAAAPVFMAGITSWTGSWRIACFSGAVLALVVLAIVVHQRRWLDDRPHLTAGASKGIAVAAVKTEENPFSFLALPAVWLCFAFFFFTTAGLSAVQSFASPALHSLYPQLSLAVTYWMVTGFMLCSAVGMVGGGFLAARVLRLDRVIAVFLLLAGALLALAVGAAAGFGQGLAGPSRDMLIKQAAPPGATGRVYGTVYSGLDLGFSVAAPIFGWLMDHQQPQGVFYGAALALAVSVLAAGAVGSQVQQQRLQAI